MSKHTPPPPRRAVQHRASPSSPPKWRWHLRTLLALRDHVNGSVGDREREPYGSMEPPSLHAEDLVDEQYDRGLAAALPSDPSEALREIDAAIVRIKAGTYGRCEQTGRAIPRAELLARPWRRCRE